MVIGRPLAVSKCPHSTLGKHVSTHTSNKKMEKLVCGRHLVSFCGHRASPCSFQVPHSTLGKHVLHPHLQQKDGEARLWSSPRELLWSSGIPSQFPSVHITPWGNMSSTHTSNKKMAKLICSRHLMSFCGHRASPRSFQVST